MIKENKKLTYKEIIEEVKKITTAFRKEKTERDEKKKELKDGINDLKEGLDNYYPNSIKAAESELKGTKFKNTQELIAELETILKEIEEEEKEEKKVLTELLSYLLVIFPKKFWKSNSKT